MDSQGLHLKMVDNQSKEDTLVEKTVAEEVFRRRNASFTID